MNTTFKMPVPSEANNFDSHALVYSPDELKQALRDILEQAARIAFSANCRDGDDYAHGYNKATREIERAIRAMIGEIK
jgi:hypothetical protein